MRTPTFAVAVAMATALHAEPIEQYLRTLRGEGVSGLHDATVLILDWRYERCTPPEAPIARPGQVPVVIQHHARTRTRDEDWMRYEHECWREI